MSRLLPSEESEVFLSMAGKNIIWNGSQFVGSIDLVAQDAQGNPVVNYDPDISLASSRVSRFFYQTKILALKIAANIGLSSSVNASAATVLCTKTNASGQSTCQVTVPAASPNVTLELLGAKMTAPLELTFQAPALSVANPISNHITSVPSITIDGNCDSDWDISATGAGLASDATVTCANNIYSINANLSGSDGLKTILVSQVDPNGNIAKITVQITLDTMAPSLSISSPSANQNAMNGITLTGTCETDLPIVLSGTGLSSPPSTTCTNGAFSQAIVFTVGEGAKNIVVTQTDSAGNIDSVNRTFINDTTAPVLAWTTPAANSSAQSGLTITGSCETGLSISASGSGLSSPITTSCTSNSFSEAITFSATEGVKNIILTQTDAAGNSATINRDFIRDNTGPILTFSSPTAGTTAQSGLTISGACETGNNIQISGTGVSSSSSTTCASGTFSQAITFSATDGTKNVILTQADAAGNSTSINRDFIKDNTGPTLTFTSPTVNAVGQSGVTIAGTCETGLTLQMSGAGLSSPTSTTCASGTFSQALVFTVTDGTKNIVLTQTDDAGNSTSINRDFIKDSTSPTLTLSSPAANTPAKTGITLVGTCESGVTIQLTGSGLASPASTTCTTSAFSQAITFTTVDGPKNIILTQTDAAGNSTSINRDFVRDNVGPNLTFTSPAANTAAQAGLTITGTCETGQSIALSGAGLDSPSSTACTAGIFSEAIVFSGTDGIKNIVITQSDVAGNSSSVNRNFMKDTAAPALSFTGPAPNTTGQTGLTMTGACEDGYTISISGTGLASPSSTTCSSGTFSQAITFTAGEGTKNIIISQTNGLGNTATLNRDFVRDNTGPTLTFTSPTANSLGQTGITIAGACESGQTIQLTGTGLTSPASTTCTSNTYSQAIVFTSGDGTKNIILTQADAAGNSTSINRNFVRDNTGPALTFTGPAAATETQTGLTVTGACETGQTITLSGTGLASPSSTTCTSSAYSQAIVFTSGEGTKNIILTQTDTVGNSTSINRDFIRDNTGPTLTFTSPTVNTAAQTGLTIAGACETGQTIALSGTGLASPSTTTCTSSAYSQAIVFTSGEGTKNIILTQTDAAGNSTSINRDFIKDTTGPSLTFSTPADGTPGKTGVTITGTCETGQTISLSGSGLASPSTTTCTSSVFSQTITFTGTDGSKAITLTQSDGTGNSTSVSRNFVRDNVAPAISFVSSGVQDQTSALYSSAFSGSCETGATIDVTLSPASTPEGTTTCDDSGSWVYNSVSQTTDGLRTYSIKASDAAGNSTTITGTWTRDATVPSLTLSAPTAGVLVAGGANLTIQWTGSDTHLDAFPIKLEYTTNAGSSWSTITLMAANSGSYIWTLPTVNTTQARVRVTLTDSIGNATTATSDDFSIDSISPIITLTSFTGGQLVKGGSSQSITWTASDTNMAANPISLSYSSDNGSTWTSIASAQANSGSYSWTVPGTDSTRYLVRATAVDKVSHSSTANSSSNFTVDAVAPAISNLTVNGATGGITIGTTSTVTIAWTAADLNFDTYPIMLAYSANGGTAWTNITSSAITNSPSSYTWNLNGLGLSDGTTYKVRVTAADKVGNVTSSATSNFTITSTAPHLTFTNGTNTNLYTNTNTVTYTGACTNGYSITITGTDSTNTTATCTAAAWTWTSGTKSSDGSVTYTFNQDNGAYSASISAQWTRDTVAPSVSSVSVNGGATNTSVSQVSVAVAVSDNNMNSLMAQITLANDSSVCPASSAGTWSSIASSGAQTYNYSLPPVDGTKVFCIYAKDAAGNISTVHQGSSIVYSSGTLPVITSFNVKNGVTQSANYGKTTYALGDTVEISWVIDDTEGLSNNPVTLEYTTDGITWTTIIRDYGSLSSNPTNYSSTYLGFSAPSTGFFRVRVRALDAAGNYSSPAVSAAQNSGAWQVYAGSTDRGIGGTAKALTLATNLYGGGLVAVDPATGDIYAIDTSNGIVKIDGTTNIASTFIGHGATNLSTSGGVISASSLVASNNSSIVFDGGYLYLMDGIAGGNTISARIYRIDPTTKSYVLYLGGGTNAAPGATSTAAFVMFDAFRFDENHSLYYFSSCANPTSSYSGSSTMKLMKVTQVGGVAGTISHVAGNCVQGTPVSGTTATDTPLLTNNQIGVSSLAVWDNGNTIYFRAGFNTTVYKILNGTLYSTAVTTGGNQYLGLAYSSAANRLYVALGSVIAYVPSTSGANGETSSTVVTSGGTGVTCGDDGQTANSNACTSAYKVHMGANGQLLFLDGSIAVGRPYRIRFIDSSLKTRTLAGSKAYYGDGLNRLLTRGNYRGIHYKKSSEPNTGAFPEGLYFTDPKGFVLGRIGTNDISTIVWGNQSGLAAPSSYGGAFTVSPGVTYGSAYGSPNNSSLSLAFDSQGLPWTKASYTQFLYLDTSLHPNLLSTSSDAGFNTNNWMYAPTSASPAALAYYFAAANNTTLKDDGSAHKGFFSLGAYYSGSWTSPGPVLRFFDFTENKIYHIMGNAATASASADATTASDLSALTFPTACQSTSTTGCFTRFYEGPTTALTDDVLYFSEGTKLRMITNPLTPGSQTLKTLFTESATISNFILTPDQKHLYYVMNGFLYCYAMSIDDESNGCRNRKSDVTTFAGINLDNHGPLGPPTGMSTLAQGADSMTWKDNKTLFITPGTGEIYQYSVPQPTAVTLAMTWGVNGHPYNADHGGDSNFPNQVQILSERNLKTYRVNGNPALAGGPAKLAYWLSYTKPANIDLLYVLELAWIACPNDGKSFPVNATPTSIYNSTYNATYNFVVQFRNDVRDWELGNELNLKTGTAAAPGAWGYGFNASEWSGVAANGSSDYYLNWSYALKGASDAITAVNQQYGTHMRSLFGTTATHFGLLSYMQQQGVHFDVISYHAYYNRGTSAYKLSGLGYWWNQFSRLAQFNLPVQMTEMNCGEIYNSSFQNTTSDPMFKTCMENLRVQLGYWKNNTQIDLEKMILYELYDEPALVTPENRFGLYWNVNNVYTPKPLLYLVSAFSGGALSPSEEAVLVNYVELPIP